MNDSSRGVVHNFIRVILFTLASIIGVASILASGGGGGGGGNGTVTPLPGTLQFSSAAYSVAENGGSINITVTRTGGSDGSVTVAYTTTNGTATSGSDYTATSGTLTFADGVTSQNFSIPILNDTAYEGDETLSIALSNATGGATLGTPNTATLTITDDDPAPLPGTLQFSSAAYSVAENGGSINITVTRTGGSAGSVTVDYTTSNGTATSGSDYTATSGTLTFTDGVTNQSFAIPILDDTTYEGNETVIISLSNVTGGAELGTPNSAVLTISENEVSSIQFTSSTYSVAENVLLSAILVRRSGSTSGTTTVDYSTSDGTATAGSDYTATSGTLTFTDGEIFQTITIPILGDSVYEGNETLNITLSNVTGEASLGSPNTAVLTITDDDPLTTSISVSWNANRESAVNAPGGGYRVYYSTTPGFDIATANVIDEPYVSGPSAHTSTTIQLASGTYYFKVVAYSALNSAGSEPSQESSIVIP